MAETGRAEFLPCQPTYGSPELVHIHCEGDGRQFDPEALSQQVTGKHHSPVPEEDTYAAGCMPRCMQYANAACSRQFIPILNFNIYSYRCGAQKPLEKA